MSKITVDSHNEQIDTGLYDRQIRTYGLDAVLKIASSSITIIGLEKGLATEICKNLTLGGIKNIYLYDNNLITLSDLETGIYYTEDDIGKPRSDILKIKLGELNSNVSIHSINDEKDIPKDSCLILVNQKLDFIKQFLPNYSTQPNIIVFSKGCAGTIFVDVKDNHVITDLSSENIEPVQIGDIYQDGIVATAPNTVHDYQTGDYVSFTNLEGDNLDIFKNEFQIEVVSPNIFKLKNFELKDKFNFKNGTSTIIKKPISINHQSFNDILKNHKYNFSFDNSELIFNSLLKYFSDSNEYSDDEQKLANTFDVELIPVVSIMGSVVASETIKIVSHKYMPIDQIWCWYDPILIPSNPTNKEGKTALSYLYGNDFDESIQKSSWLIVGSGAIGCELLKNLAFLNVSSKDNGHITLTDPDHIEKSNLNRQFLFRNSHIGNSKSIIAANAIQKMKSNINIKALTEKVSDKNQSFTNTIMKNINGVFNALDNVEARKYMDRQCFYNQLPLFESGTTGTKGNTQAVIPFLTETYSNSADPPVKSFPICTIKSFPNEIQHTIFWAMDNFELFNRAPININRWIKDSTIFDDKSIIENRQGKEDVMNFLIKMNIKTFEDCVYNSIKMFYENYKNTIIQLLICFPADKEIDGKPYWSNGKRMPKSFDLDINNDYHLDYIEATSHLISRCYNIPDDFNREQIKEFCSKINYNDDFKPDENKKIASNDSEIKIIESSTDINLPTNEKYQSLQFISQEFEKDDPTNWHVAWVNAASNMRALNYSIPPVSHIETKGIAGRIIPAIATTTSVVSGLIVIEMIKYMLANHKIIEHKIENYRSTFVNLSDTTLVYSEPIKSEETEFAGVKFSIWEKFNYNQDSTLKEFKKYFEDKFKNTIDWIIYNVASLSEEENMDKKISVLIKEIDSDADFIENSVIIMIGSYDENIIFPDIHFSLAH